MKEKTYSKKSRRVLKLFLVVFLFLSIAGHAEAAPIKVLSDSRHAYSGIVSTINKLIGASHVGTDIIVHSTNMNLNGGFSVNLSTALNTTATYYDQSGTAVPSQAPYNIFTTSATGYNGDNITEYNYSNTYDIAHNYAYSAKLPAGSPPPAFHFNVGMLGSFQTGPGIEWRLDPSVFPATFLSEATADNAGVMAVLMYNHPTWNLFDVKAALRQTGTNWATGYDDTKYGFGIVSYASSTALTDSGIFLQPPEVKISTTTVGQISFTLFPFKQTRRVKEVMFEFSSTTPPTFHGSELTLSGIQALGGTKIMESASTSAQILTPIYTPLNNDYFVWFTADNSTDSLANFSRIDTYSILGPFTQSKISFSTTFDVSSPLSNSISTSTTPLLKWSTAKSYFGGISKYQLFVDGVLNKDNITATSTTPTSGLSAGTHTWYIKAFNGDGDSLDSTSTYTINIIPGYAQGHTFYVDNVLGNNSNIGSKTSPWKTLKKGASTAQAGDTVIIIKNTGVPYRETLTPANSGNTTDGNITFRGENASSKPEIWGSDDMSQSTVGGWTTYSGGATNTYQKSVTVLPAVFAAGSSILNLSKKTPGSVVTTLNTGEWYYSSGILYYRLATGENISTLHIEVGTRNYGVNGTLTQYLTYKDLVVKYANQYGFEIADNTNVYRSEVYDSNTGIIISGSNSTVQYSVMSDNNSYGIYLSVTVGVKIHNNIFNGNSVGLYLVINATNAVIKNNTSSNNSLYDFQFLIFSPLVNFIASNNNWSGSGDSNWQNTYKGTNNQASLSPLFTNIATRNFKLKQFSPDIDTGTITTTTATTDILGNPIYGTPDIGPYEYQPPYTIGTNNIPTTGSVRIYTNGKYRMKTATSTSAATSFTVTPLGGYSTTTTQYMDLTINKWETTGDKNKQWTVTSATGSFLTHATTTVYTVGGLLPNTYYQFKIDGSASTTAITGSKCNSNGVCFSGSNGQAVFNYIGGYSTHTFALTKDITSPNSFSLTTPDNAKTSNIRPTLSWSLSYNMSGISKYQLYIDGSLNRDNIASSTTSVTSAKALNCGSHTWYVIAVDNKGNKTNSNTYTVNVVCGSIIPVFFPTKTTQSTRTHIKAVQSTTNKTATQNKPAQAKSTKQTTNLSNIQIQSIISVLKSFGVDTATIAKVQKALQGVPTTNTTPTTSTHTTQTQAATSHTTFIPFKHTLYPGLYSKSVTRLQRLLSKDHSVYPEGLVTGYYGSLTTKAVRRFQRKHNIVYSGSISATGYGMVGPRTRRDLNLVGR